ncbi:MAG TPA: excalibur calcium-binding domain-containing protein [Solirubrobacterales bacterium]|nr:excalibur calcium-binding domain-containing protein [Solirubrobacterales bacterium]
MQSNVRPLRLLLSLAVVAVAALALLPLGSSASAPRGCGFFKSQAEAQDYFVGQGGTIEDGVGKLDPDHDGVACEGLTGPYAGYATLGYNKKRNFFYGVASLPPSGEGGEYPCMIGNRHFSDAPRRLNVYKVTADGNKPIFNQFGLGAEAQPETGHLIWRADRKVVIPGSYFAEFEERARTTAYGGIECPPFRSPIVRLP